MKKTKEKKNMEIFQQKTNCFLYIFNFHSVIFPSFVFSSQCTHRATTGYWPQLLLGFWEASCFFKTPFFWLLLFSGLFFLLSFPDENNVFFFSAAWSGKFKECGNKQQNQFMFATETQKVLHCTLGAGKQRNLHRYDYVNSYEGSTNV